MGARGIANVGSIIEDDSEESEEEKSEREERNAASVAGILVGGADRKSAQAVVADG